MRRIRELLAFSERTFLLVAIMFVGSAVLWVGVPAGWLWVGSQIQGETGSLGLALIVMIVGVVGSVGVLVGLLVWLVRKHSDLQEARGRIGAAPIALEAVMVSSAVVAVAGFAVWFFGFSGSSPVPVNIGF